ncbi:MAG TPA: 4'-phosphopantetheinyl transferase superfamily protein [Rhodanobacteraceae bacterium]
MTAAIEFIAAEPSSVAATLDAGTIHLWRLPYARAQRRGPLRALLAAYLGIPATSVVLGAGVHGKPYLAHGTCDRRGAPQPLRFNWSHSGDYALLAIARDADVEVGVDIERVDARRRGLEIAWRFFTHAEAQRLAALDDAARALGFTKLWCAKEAVLKAAGEGLAFGLERIACAWDGNAWTLSAIDAALGELQLWRLRGFSAAAGYCAALAWHGNTAALPMRIDAFQPAANG